MRILVEKCLYNKQIQNKIKSFMCRIAKTHQSKYKLFGYRFENPWFVPQSKLSSHRTLSRRSCSNYSRSLFKCNNQEQKSYSNISWTLVTIEKLVKLAKQGIAKVGLAEFKSAIISSKDIDAESIKKEPEGSDFNSSTCIKWWRLGDSVLLVRV